MGWAGAPSPSTAHAPEGKGFPCRAGPWRVHCPMHPARSAVAPGALEMGPGPLPQLSGTMVQLQPLLTRVLTVPRQQPLAFCNQFQPPWERPLSSRSFRDPANHKTPLSTDSQPSPLSPPR